MTKRVYLFNEGSSTMRDLLGGKGANLAEMTNIGLPVPPGFTITTEVCTEYLERGKSLPPELMDEVRGAIAQLEQDLGKKFGDPSNPLLVSVRSGAKFSMPGMMDTILNLGLNRDTLRGMVETSGNERFAQDANRRFIMMFGDVVLGIPKERFEKIFEEHKKRAGVRLDTEVRAETLRSVCHDFLALVLREKGEGFPGDPWKQLEMAVEAVFSSWDNDRARTYRKRERIPDDLGTAVNVQAMVYGNLGTDCGTGVAFTRDPANGERMLYGEYLMNAQGEDVVAGVRTPSPIHELHAQNPGVYKEFTDIAQRLEGHYKDMQDLEFTIERGRLFMLQTRTGKRTGAAAVRMAVEMEGEGLISREEAVQRVNSSHLDQLLHPRIDANKLHELHISPIARGLAASPGAAVGMVVFDADKAEEMHTRGKRVILVREETNPDDVHGMIASEGVLTARGGKTSHAAVVARGFGIPCVAGCGAIVVDMEKRRFTVNDATVKEGEWITIDGSDGAVYDRQISLIDPEVSGYFETLMEWCDGYRRLGVRANADNPRDAKQAVQFGAEGIGLCRTEHMFFESDRLPIVRQMILTDDDAQRDAALQKLRVVQQSDFEQIFEVMDGRPVTIRLIDPPLHEFLPNHDDLLRQVTELKLANNAFQGSALGQVLGEREELLEALEGMRESNPMLGLRGVRLSLVLPGIVEMQTHAAIRAALKLKRRGIDVRPEIMVPLVGHVRELSMVREKLVRVAEQILADSDVKVDYSIGTMIEVPRAALTAGDIAKHAQFFSFGTNDLTQMTFAFSRDDAEGRFLQDYLDQKVLADNPFETIDQVGVGRLMRLAVEEGRATRPDLKCGICGEHGGETRSIEFCHRIGLDYVSCSPYRVPIARLAAAQAALLPESA